MDDPEAPCTKDYDSASYFNYWLIYIAVFSEINKMHAALITLKTFLI